MKRLLALLLVLTLALALTACGGDTAETPDQPAAEEETPAEQEAPAEEPPAAPDLTGEWTQKDSEPESWQAATITADTIEVYWVSDGGDTKALYWAGTYTAPTTADEPYAWDSQNDTEKTSASLLASGDDTKTFTYEDGEISYELTALGVTTTVHLIPTEG